MAESGVTVDGLRRFVRSLEELGVEVGDLKTAFGEISDLAATAAAGYAPSLTGTLRRSIKGSKTKNRAVVRAGAARVPYAAPINYGWRRRNITPRLFMQRADEQVRPQVIPTIEHALGNIMREKGLI